MLTINSKFKDYNVNIEKNMDFLNSLFEIPYSQFVIDAHVYELYEGLFSGIDKNRLFLVTATEENKTLDTALEICEKITEIAAKRNTTLISIGGGIIQDLTGFVANITYRGIKWIFVPTTLLAACDSCIGGKTSLNYHKFKNLLGTFYPPDEIYICPEFFNTLSPRDLKSGLGEVVKFNIMKGAKGLEGIERDIDALIATNPDKISEYVLSSLEFKKNFIEIDEFDRGERIKLNFAHTFGHAIEVVSKYEIPHGTAVAIGMIMADSISLKRGMISQEIVERAQKVLLSVIDIDTSLLNAPIEEYIAAIRKDKKQTSEALTAVLISEYDASASLLIVHDLTVDEVIYAIDYFVNLYKG